LVTSIGSRDREINAQLLKELSMWSPLEDMTGGDHPGREIAADQIADFLRTHRFGPHNCVAWGAGCFRPSIELIVERRHGARNRRIHRRHRRLREIIEVVRSGVLGIFTHYPKDLKHALGFLIRREGSPPLLLAWGGARGWSGACADIRRESTPNAWFLDRPFVIRIETLGGDISRGCGSSRHGSALFAPASFYIERQYQRTNTAATLWWRLGSGVLSAVDRPSLACMVAAAPSLPRLFDCRDVLVKISPQARWSKIVKKISFRG